MSDTETKKPSKFSYIRRHKMNFFGAFCFAGDVALIWRGAFKGDLNAGIGGAAITTGALSSTFGGPKTLTASTFILGGIENIVSGVKGIQQAGLTGETAFQTAFGVALTVAPIAMFYGHQIVESVTKSSLFVKLAKEITGHQVVESIKNNSVFSKLAREITSATQERVGSVIYNVGAVSVGVSGVSALAHGLQTHNTHSIEGALMGLGISALFIAGNTIAGMTPAPESKDTSIRIPRSKSGLQSSV